MSDVFDDLAKQFGIKRESAIRTYSVSVVAGFQEKVGELEQKKQILSQSLHLLAEMIRSESPAIRQKLEIRLKQLALETSDISDAVEVVQAALNNTH